MGVIQWETIHRYEGVELALRAEAIPFCACALICKPSLWLRLADSGGSCTTPSNGGSRSP